MTDNHTTLRESMISLSEIEPASKDLLPAVRTLIAENKVGKPGSLKMKKSLTSETVEDSKDTELALGLLTLAVAQNGRKNLLVGLDEGTVCTVEKRWENILKTIRTEIKLARPSESECFEGEEVTSPQSDASKGTKKSWTVVATDWLLGEGGVKLWVDESLNGTDDSVMTVGSEFARLGGTRCPEARKILRRILRKQNPNSAPTEQQMSTLIANLASFAETPVKIATRPMVRGKNDQRIILMESGKTAILPADGKDDVKLLDFNDPRLTGVVFNVKMGFPDIDFNIENPLGKALRIFRFLNFGANQRERDDIAKLLMVSVVFRLWDEDRHPQLSIFMSGRRGGGKTTAAELLGQLVTPFPSTEGVNSHIHGWSMAAQDLDELARITRGEGVTSLDNVGTLTSRMSDDLASFLSGSHHSVRRLFSEAVESISMTKLWVLTGVFPSGLPDLIDRLVELPISSHTRPTPDDLKDGESFDEWIERHIDEARSAIVVIALKTAKTLTDHPMAPIPQIRFGAFGQFVRAFDRMTGWDVENIAVRLHADATIANVGDNAFATLLFHASLKASDGWQATVQDGGFWLGSSTDLLGLLDADAWSKSMPVSIRMNAVTVGRELAKVGPALEVAGWKIEQILVSKRRLWKIFPSSDLSQVDPFEASQAIEAELAEHGGRAPVEPSAGERLAQKLESALPQQLALVVAEASVGGEKLKPEWQAIVDGQPSIDSWEKMLWEDLNDDDFKTIDAQLKTGVPANNAALRRAILADEKIHAVKAA